MPESLARNLMPQARSDARSEPEMMRLWFRFLRLHQRVSTAMTGRLKRIGLSVPQFDLLSTLGEREGITQTELAQRLYVTKGNVSGLVDRMVGMGLIERRETVGDRRSYALFLTAEGRSLTRQGLVAQEAYVRETLGALPERDLAELERIILNWRDRARTSSS
jgi:DNA-binding MarR family transcriptional regulator